MKFGIFYDHQPAAAVTRGRGPKLFQEALAKVELADRLGVDHAWEVELHFLEEYSHFLAAKSS